MPLMDGVVYSSFIQKKGGGDACTDKTVVVQQEW
jgi:hypothetical protein